MSAIAYLLSADDVRQIQYDVLDDRKVEYLRTGPAGTSTVDDVRHRVRRVSDSDIRQALRAVATFQASEIAAAWSRFMAVAAGRHLFPDANRRTAMTAFNLAVERALGLRVGLAEESSRRMVVESKAMRDAPKRERGSYYTVAELADAAHPYRRLFERYERRLHDETAP